MSGWERPASEKISMMRSEETALETSWRMAESRSSGSVPSVMVYLMKAFCARQAAGQH
jgi:hypothetical protein